MWMPIDDDMVVINIILAEWLLMLNAIEINTFTADWCGRPTNSDKCRESNSEAPGWMG